MTCLDVVDLPECLRKSFCIGRVLDVGHADIPAARVHIARPVATEVQVDHQHHVLEMVGRTSGSKRKGHVRLAPPCGVWLFTGEVCRNLVPGEKPHLDSAAGPLGGKHTAPVLVEC